MTITYHGGNIIRGTSTDRTGGTWTNLQAGFIFIESDTLLIYYWNGSAWSLIAAPGVGDMTTNTAQTVTGAKTFNSGTLRISNAANTNSAVLLHPSWPSSGTWELESAPSQMVYKAGTTIKRMNMITKFVESSGTVASTVIQAALDAVGTFSGKAVGIKNGSYTIDTTLNVTAAGGNLDIVGLDNNQTWLKPSGDFPALEVVGKSYVNIKNLGFLNQSTTYSSPLLEFKNGTAHNRVIGCHFEDSSGSHVGYGIGLTGNGSPGHVYSNYFIDNYFAGVDSCVRITNTAAVDSTHFINSNSFIVCEANAVKNFLTHNTAAVSQNDANNFIGCEMQSYAGTLSAFDYSTNHLGSSNNTFHDNNFIWDLPVGTYYALGNNITTLSLVNCMPAERIGGALATNGKIRTFDQYTMNRGKSTQTQSSATNKTFTIAHSLRAAPNHVNVGAGSADSIGPFYWTSDATNITVTFPIPPPTGTNNIVLHWNAEVF